MNPEDDGPALDEGEPPRQRTDMPDPATGHTGEPGTPMNTARRILAASVLLLIFVASSQAEAPTPARFDWVAKGVATGVRHQGKFATCWAMTAVGALEANRQIRTGARVILAAQPLIDRLRPESPDGGVHFEIALTDLVRNGTATVAGYPYQGKRGTPKDIASPYKAARWGMVGPEDRPPTAAEIKSALLAHGPLPVTVNGFAHWGGYKGGVYRDTRRHTADTHAVLLVGYDDAKGAWKIRNSWGMGWGEKGFMWLAYGTCNLGAKTVWVESR